MEEQNQDEKMWHNVFQQLMHLYITPELKRRQNAGELPEPDLLSAQIIFYPDGKPPQVRINSEVKGIAWVKLKPCPSKKSGEAIYENEIEEVAKINLSQGENPDCAHITILKTENTWRLAVDLRYNKALSRKHIEVAKEFFESAQNSFEQKKWHPFIENLFAASELSAKAVLLLIHDPKFMKTKKHSTIHSRYNQFANLGNVEVDYKNTFNTLTDLRPRARYLNRTLSISEKDAQNFLNTVRAIIDDAELRTRT